ncbi:hypothetical protein ACWCPF_26810 [Streptomyces sp. NPDC001858]
MTAGSPDAHEPSGALQRLAREVAALRAAAGGPSLRELADLVHENKQGDLPATASYESVRVIVKGRQRTRLDTLKSVVLQLLRMDGTSRTPEQEQAAWAHYETLWCDALREAKSGATPETTAAAQRFAARLRTAVLTPLGGDHAVIGDRLRELLRAGEPDDGVAPAALSAVAQGTLTPRPREVALLLDLLAQDGRPLSRADRQALMLDYLDLLKRSAPELHDRFMTDELLDAYRCHSAAERAERLRQKQSHKANEARLAARLKRVENERAEAKGELVTMREERDRLAALAIPQQPQPQATAPTPTPAPAPEPIAEPAIAALPPWESLAPLPFVADIMDPHAQYGYSASSAWDPNQWHHPGDGYFHHSDTYHSDTYDPGSWTATPWAATTPYLVTEYGVTDVTAPPYVPPAPRRRLVIARFPAAALPEVPRSTPPAEPQAVPPAAPPAVPPPPRKLRRALAAVFRRGGDGRHRNEGGA